MQRSMADQLPCDSFQKVSYTWTPILSKNSVTGCLQCSNGYICHRAAAEEPHPSLGLELEAPSECTSINPELTSKNEPDLSQA